MVKPDSNPEPPNSSWMLYQLSHHATIELGPTEALASSLFQMMLMFSIFFFFFFYDFNFRSFLRSWVVLKRTVLINNDAAFSSWFSSVLVLHRYGQLCLVGPVAFSCSPRQCHHMPGILYVHTELVPVAWSFCWWPLVFSHIFCGILFLSSSVEEIFVQRETI